MSRGEISIPRQDGRFALVTGTGGLGFAAAAMLARAGAEVVIAGRNAAKGAEAVAGITAIAPAAEVRFEPLDLASMASVADLAAKLEGGGRALDLLICNAGVMSPPERRTTADGFELQFGVNYLGHFALAAQLLPLLRQAQAPRVVSVTSLAHRYGKLDFADLQSERNYQPGRAYCASKLAQALFVRELQRRSDDGGWGLTSVAAHPGFARTNLFRAEHRRPGMLESLGLRIVGAILGHSAEAGAAPLVHAAASPEAAGGELYGPKGLLEMKGLPGRCEFAARALDQSAADRLWRLSEVLAGVRFPETLPQ
jgi:NAD(P)-dependent dehydrogenase (short-subunit alcohol dehydrogenase family)